MIRVYGPISPTKFQAGTFPPSFRDHSTVAHDGIDNNEVAANPDAVLQVGDGQSLTGKDEVVIFINVILNLKEDIMCLCGLCRSCCAKDQKLI